MFYNLHNFNDIPQIRQLSVEERCGIDIVARIFPFKVSSHVIEQLIDWSSGSRDPMFRAVFPHRDMIEPADFERLHNLIQAGESATALEALAQDIRNRQNPDASGQHALNIPAIDGRPLHGMQHKYRETLLVFPSEGQNCNTWCSFCFRWNQFVKGRCPRFSDLDPDNISAYLTLHRDITDILITGGDPLVMSAPMLGRYVEPLLRPEADHIRNIRIGTKLLAWDPERFLSAPDTEELYALFSRIKRAGRNLTVVAHWTHPRELHNATTRAACQRLQEQGIQLRGQTPLLKGINDEATTLADLWRTQTALGCTAYYLFVARDTGAHRYFEVPLMRAWQLYRDSFSAVSGLARSVRGPVMSCEPGKVIIDGPLTIGTEKALSLRYLQARHPELVGRPFLAQYDECATWWNQLRPWSPEYAEFFN